MERLIRKGRFKDAVWQAKLCYKESATPENHRLLERAYFLRSRQLLQMGMRSSAVEVAQHLLDFGVTPSEWVDEFIRLLVDLGLGKKALQVHEGLGSSELKDQLFAMAADQAVVHPEPGDEISPELARDASLIRQSLGRLHANDEAGALLLLRDLARSSPLSEWKYFVRGMAAFFRHDTDDMQANWDRLDSKRKAFLIAQRLRRLVQAETPHTDDAVLAAMETAAFGERVLARLQQVRSLAATQEWDELIRLLGPLRHSLCRIDPTLAERLTLILIGPLIKEAASMEPADLTRLVSGFTKAAEPIKIDPNWNRLRAMVWDGPDDHLSESLAWWAKYIEDLKTIPAFGPSQRALAQAMIWNHMARQYCALAEDFSDSDRTGPPFLPYFRSRATCEAVDDAQKKAVECLEKSLALAPLHLPTYQALVEAYCGRDEPSGLESAARRLLERFPDDLATLTLLAHHCLRRDDPFATLPLVLKARALKPLDESLRSLEASTRIGLARHHALAKQWDEGRKQFRLAEELLPGECHRYDYLARKVIFEAKASRVADSDQFLREARAGLVEPTPLWLALSIESIRYRTTKSTVDGYAALLASDLRKKCRSETAGLMASLLDSFLSTRIEYPGQAGHVKQVAAYLERSSRVNYLRADIERVVEFLCRLPDKRKTLNRTLKKGLKQYPESALLNFRAGLLEIENGPLAFAGVNASGHLEQALELAQASSASEDTALLPGIRIALTLINEMRSRTLGIPGAGDDPFSFFFSGGDFDPSGFDDDFFDDDDDDDDSDASYFSTPRPRRTPKKRKPPKKR
jgi:hypothetical protein